MYVYHYTSRDTALEYILHNNQLRFAPLLKSNDPFESELLGIGEWGKIDMEDNYNKLIDKDSIHIFCTCMNDNKVGDSQIRRNFTDNNCYGKGFANPQMWAHYGGKHSVVCLEIDKEKLVKIIKDKENNSDEVFAWTSEINYKEFNCKDNPVNGLNNISSNEPLEVIRNLVFIKDKTWEHEREYRFFIHNKRKEDDYISAEDLITGIIITKEFHDAYYPLLREYCRSRDIPCVFLSWDNGLPWTAPLQWSKQ